MRSHFYQELVRDRDGTILRGHFWTHNGIVTAKLGSRQKTTQIGGSPPKTIAKLMMHEMHEAGQRQSHVQAAVGVTACLRSGGQSRRREKRGERHPTGLTSSNQKPGRASPNEANPMIVPKLVVVTKAASRGGSVREQRLADAAVLWQTNRRISDACEHHFRLPRLQ